MIPVVKSNEPIIARAMSFFWWREIVLGARFDGLNPQQQAAVLAHESAHIESFHTEQRLACLLLSIFLLPMLACRQELEADRIAAERGHAEGLLSLLSSEYDGGWLQPSHAERRQALMRHVHLRLVPVKDSSPDSA